MHPLIKGLLRPEAYGHPVSEFQVLETHISWVILTGDYAYKLKKPVNLGFVDFTSLELRRFFCDEEIRLNRRWASDLYVGVRPIYGPPEQPSFCGSGTPIEFAVQMRQFDQAQLLPAVLRRGKLRADHIDRLALTIADFHHRTAVAEPASFWGTPEAVRIPVRANFHSLESAAASISQLRPLKAWSDEEFERRKDWFQYRHDSGKIRECHGDLHLGNMVLLNDEIRLFDGLEFNPELRWIDVISEVAFLVMDLQDRGRPDFGIRFLNRWLDQTGDFEALAGWRWYQAYRALVRAKVATLRLQQPDIDSSEQADKQREIATYVDLAAQTIKTRATPLIVMHGVSGSGKSHVAQWLSERLGAITLRSDVERKRFFGKWGTPSAVQLEEEMYDPKVTRQVYEKLAGLIPDILEAGFPVIVDAACLKVWQRTLFRDLAKRLGAPSIVCDVTAQPDTMRIRLVARQSSGADPSDADSLVMQRQLSEREAFTAEELPDTVTINTETSEWMETLDRDLGKWQRPNHA